LMAGVERQRRGHRWATLNSRCGDVDSVVMIAGEIWVEYGQGSSFGCNGIG
jgi:hypothetical protein